MDVSADEEEGARFLREDGRGKPQGLGLGALSGEKPMDYAAACLAAGPGSDLISTLRGKATAEIGALISSIPLR